MTRYFLDTEFVEDGRTIMPISIGVVSSSGREFYAEFDFDEGKAMAHDFVRENVLPHLREAERLAPKAVADALLRFIGDDPCPEFWAWYGAYDWVLVCQMFGTMMDLPRHFPMFVHDLKALCSQLGIVGSQLPLQPASAHCALADARWVRDAHLMVECLRPGPR
jgi:hypothetical protein